MNITRTLKLGALALIALALSACSSVMPPPTASAGNIEKLREAKIAPAMTGSFVLAAGKPPSMDTSISSRASTVNPAGGSFALQLRDQLVADLKGAGLYDTASKNLIEGQLTDSMLDTGMSTGKGRLAARFIVKREGKTVFDKELAAEATWESSFVGAVAIPAAINQYGALYKTLVGKLIDDPDFRAALAR